MGSLGTALCLTFPIAVLCWASCLPEVSCQVIFPHLHLYNCINPWIWGLDSTTEDKQPNYQWSRHSLFLKKPWIQFSWLRSTCGLCVPANLSTGTSLKHGPSSFCRAVIHIEAANFDIPCYFFFLLGGDWAWMSFSYSNLFLGRRNPCPDMTRRFAASYLRKQRSFL